MIKKVTKTKRAVKKELPRAERGFGVILEDIDSKFDRILEGHSALEKQASDFQGETRENFKLVHLRIDGLSENLEGFKLETRSNFESFRVETRSNFESVFEFLSNIDDELQDIHDEIDELKLILTNKADLDRVADLEKRVQHIESILAKSK